MKIDLLSPAGAFSLALTWVLLLAALVLVTIHSSLEAGDRLEAWGKRIAQEYRSFK